MPSTSTSSTSTNHLSLISSYSAPVHRSLQYQSVSDTTSNASSLTNDDALSHGDSVVVAVRIKPPMDKESLENEDCVSVEGRMAQIEDPFNADKKHYFTYDYVYDGKQQTDQQRQQAAIFNDLGTLALDNAFKGYNATIFAYGQTGSGKTFT